jgi:hypothetical protein
MTASTFLNPSDPLQPGPLRSSDGPRFIIGRGRRGGWIVNDRLGLVGGIFVSETAARHFAFEESGGRIEQIVVINCDDLMDLDLRRIS